MILKKVFAGMFFVFIICCTTYVFAQVPQTMNYQGKITDGEGVALNGTYTINFGIYNLSSGGSPLWSETRTVSVVNGLFDIQLGTVTPINLDFSEPYWLELRISSDGGSTWETFDPRERLASVSYSFRSEYAENATNVENALQTVSTDANPTGRVGNIRFIPREATTVTESATEDTIYIAITGGEGGGDDEDWTGAGTGQMYATNPTDNVGIGTTTPTSKLEVRDGNLMLRQTPDGSNVQITMITNDSGGGAGEIEKIRQIDGHRDSNALFIRTVVPDGGDLVFIPASSEALRIKTDGDVGIGTNAPGEKMHLFGAATGRFALKVENTTAGGSPYAALQMKTGSSSNVWQWFARDNAMIGGIDGVADYITIKSGGNIGIGTPNPGAKVDINGQIMIRGGSPGAGKVLVATDASGIATWETPSGGGGGSHYVGELYGGGIVFYIYDNGEHGLIASLDDIDGGSGAQWSYVSGTTTGATSYWNGPANTATIVASLGAGTYAAKLCDDYTGGGQTDWYLPAEWQLNILYNQAYMISLILENDGDGTTNGFQQGQRYWSSTEYRTNDAFYLEFKTGASGATDMPYFYLVRAIRSF